MNVEVSQKAKPQRWFPGRNPYQWDFWRRCVTYYPFWGGQSTLLSDVSGYGNHGTLTNMDPATDWVATEYGLGLNFDGGDDYVEVANTPSLIPSQLTVCFLVNPTNLAAADQDIIAKRPGSNDAGYVIAALSSTTVSHYIYVAGGWHKVDLVYTNGEWQHIAMTYDGETLRGYRNGGAPVSNAIAGAITNPNSVLRLGEDTRSHARRFNGSIAHVAIWNRALTAAEIRALYTDPFLMIRYPD